MVGLAVVVGLVGCAPADDDGPRPEASAPAAAPSPTPTPAPRPVPDVPVTDAGIDEVEAVAAVPPVDLSIPSLDVSLPIDEVGVAEDGQMEIPPLAERGGWYRYGAAPGDPEGTAVIAAHVDSVASAGVGPFARLGEAQVGDEVQVVRADGAVVTYAVTGVERIAKPAVEWPDVFVRGGPARLVLVTCGGTFQRQARSYSDNVIVTAEPVGG
ncbi:class F sortase [Cellulomonas sp. APG4]|nr:class F sortase [Cellulomonas sp. APG4]NCT92422.1 class F sortase [Cellulomonas sp. APG4]